MSGFYPDPNVRLAVGGDVIRPAFPLVIDDPTYDLVRNKTIYFDGDTSTTITNTSTAWREGDTLAIVNDGSEVAVVTFVSVSPVLTQFVTPDLYPGEVVILKIANGQWVEVARKATPDKIIIESPVLVITTNDIDASPVVKFDENRVLKGGEYGLELSFESTGSSSIRAMAVELYIDNVLFNNRYQIEAKDSRDVGWITKAAKTPFLAEGAHDFRVQFGRTYGGGASTVAMANTYLSVRSIR